MLRQLIQGSKKFRSRFSQGRVNHRRHIPLVIFRGHLLVIHGHLHRFTDPQVGPGMVRIVKQIPDGPGIPKPSSSPECPVGLLKLIEFLEVERSNVAFADMVDLTGANRGHTGGGFLMINQRTGPGRAAGTVDPIHRFPNSPDFSPR